jgi:molybdopterin-guanine dinucleotide biosynthesis protein A
MNFSAVILAGGSSSRMGRDKAWLEVDGQTLLQRQIQLACGIGAQEVLISGRADVDYTEFGCRIVKDRLPNSGPMAGIAAALEAVTTPLLLVLAVDMPHMSADCLQRLLANCTPARGAMPRLNGQVEPLAAIYPRAGRETGAVKTGSARAFAERCVAAELARYVDLPASDAHCFTNWNSPADVTTTTASWHAPA